MTSITVRDVPDETRDELAARAARSGRSLQEYLRASLIDLARRPDVDVLIERVRWHKSATGSTLSAQDILALKDSDRR
ncbi:MAG TPA: antitoxin [Streptosporangiaceae bacterium]|jgi:antitoxin FitA|nr:antitoxin [Streptosporangiaceae bacterium]